MKTKIGEKTFPILFLKGKRFLRIRVFFFGQLDSVKPPPLGGFS